MDSFINSVTGKLQESFDLSMSTVIKMVEDKLGELRNINLKPNT